MKLAFIGPVGAGKTSQAQRISQMLTGYMRVSTGEMIRTHIEAGTELGRQAEGFYRRGEQVPDETILELVGTRLQPAGFWILDGFPRSLSQAQALDERLEGRRGGPLTRVIALEGPSDDELVRRIVSGRVHSQATRMVYHTENDPPPDPSEHMDPGPFVRRDDDGEGPIRKQLQIYHEEAGPLKEHYESRGLLSVVDADQPINRVTGAILEALNHPESPKQSA